MDKRQKNECGRANGSGLFSPALIVAPFASLSKFGKAHAACAFAILAAGVPALALADDSAGSARTVNVVLDVASKGSLGALVFALIAWLNAQRKERRDLNAKQRVSVDRQPPLGEDVARTYATKEDLSALDAKVSQDIAALRVSIKENDVRAEERARGTHKRIDAIYIEQLKNSKALGMLIGIMVGKGIAPAATATQINQED
jgi:hypothetical protein